MKKAFPRRAAKLVLRRWAQATRALRVLPDFLVIGTQKGGTTSLYNYLLRHPQVVRSINKEVHFFDERFHRGEAWYRGHFPTAAYRELVRRRRGVALTGESSPCYLFHPASPARVARLLPAARLVALLRDPVERAYSHYHHRVRKGIEARPFGAVVEEELRMHARGELSPEAAEPEWSTCAYQRYSLLSRGLYLEQLLRWRAVYPPDQMLVLCSEEFSRDPGRVYGQVQDFLGLRRVELAQARRYNDFGRPARMDAEVRARLVEFFDEPNRRLYEHLGRDFGWQRSGAAAAGGV